MFLFFAGFTLGWMVSAGVMVILMISAHGVARASGNEDVFEGKE